jgi:tetratricopeptide (TPR) repeat protein
VDPRRLPDAVNNLSAELPVRLQGAANGLVPALQGAGRDDEAQLAAVPVGEEPAICCLQQALVGCRELGDCWFEATTLSRLADVYLQTRRFADAIHDHHLALTIRCQIGDRRGQARAHSDLANAYRAAQRFEDAIDHYRQALAISREIGDQQTQARALDALRIAQR